MTEPDMNAVHPFLRSLQGPSKKAVVGLLAGMTVFLVAPGGFFLWLGFADDGPVVERALLLLFAAALLFLPVRVAAIAVRRKVTTGQWTITPEERLKLRRKWTSQRSLSLRWIEYLTQVVWAFIAGTWIVIVVRHPHAGLFNWMMAVFWIALATFSCWQQWKSRRKTAP